jgi:electron transport complex protein RnfC
MGGAGFPTYLKLKRDRNKSIDTVILNGCECEPFLTADDRIMREAPRLVVRGLLLAMRATGARRGIVAIEDNKPEAVSAITAAVQHHRNVELAVCPTRYPMGGERLLVPAVTNRTVPTDGLPRDVGVVVLNVATSVSLAHAVDRSNPLTHRVLTVAGAVGRPGNFFVPIGTPVSWLIAQAGGLREDAAVVILGGPMMGVTISDLSVPITKATSGITVLSVKEVEARDQTACINCGRCVDHCPLRLAAAKIVRVVRSGNLRLARSYNLMACCECGCCAYVCPAQIPLVQYIKSGKAAVLRKGAQERDRTVQRTCEQCSASSVCSGDKVAKKDRQCVEYERSRI